MKGTQELIVGEQRKEFLDYWQVHLLDPIKVCLMNKEGVKVVSTKTELYNHLELTPPNFNTRNIFPSELVIEFDVEHEIAVKGICKTILNLMEMNSYFTVWYAKGMRSPHIRIYELVEDDFLDPRVRKITKELFAKTIVPPTYYKYLDMRLFGNHKICLEFSKHWKYGTYLNMIMEYFPKQIKQSTLEIWT